jgi:FtsH-binding integral membrane protein
LALLFTDGRLGKEIGMKKVKKVFELFWASLGSPFVWLIMLVYTVVAAPFNDPLFNHLWVMCCGVIVFLGIIAVKLEEISKRLEVLGGISEDTERLSSCVKTNHHGHGDSSSISTKHWNS